MRILKYSFLTLMIIGCQNDKQIETNNQAHEKAQSDKEPISRKPDSLSVALVLDTLIINNVIFYLQEIKKQSFVCIPQENDKSISALNESKNVEIDSNYLVFHFHNGKDSTFINDISDSWSEYAIYSLIADYKQLDYWLVHISLYEGQAYFLLNKRDGSIIWTWGEPLFSPNGSQFICSSFDLEANYDINGFQLFSVRNSSIKNVWSKEIESWGPENIKWVNESEIAIKQVRLNFKNLNKMYDYKFKVMKLK